LKWIYPFHLYRKRPTMNYFDLLPEELTQYIWKFIHNDIFTELEMVMSHKQKNLPYDRGRCVRMTKQLKKRKGHYHNILKEKYNVVLFSRVNYYVPWELNHQNFDGYMMNSIDGLINSTFGFLAGDAKNEKIYLNCLRHSNKYCKMMLKGMLSDNGYRVFCYGYTDKRSNHKFIYKSWTRDRMIKELMSL